MKTVRYQEFQNLRKSKLYTCESLAEKLGLSMPLVSGWERGVSKPPLKILPKMAELLGVTVSDLVKLFELPSVKYQGFRNLRKSNGFSCRSLAEAIGVSPNLISYWEKGVCSPKFEILSKLAEALKTDIETIILLFSVGDN